MKGRRVCSACGEKGHYKNSEKCRKRKAEEDPKVVDPTCSESDDEDHNRLEEQTKRGTKPKWKNGALLEAEMGLANDYEDTFHPVRVIGVLDGNLYRCQFLAFDLRDGDVFAEERLHEMRDAVAGDQFEIGEAVHVKIAHRKVRGKEVDGEVKGTGVWVKGKIISVEESQQFHVEYNNCSGGKNRITVKRDKLRKA